jgi:hypothetical protein
MFECVNNYKPVSEDKLRVNIMRGSPFGNPFIINAKQDREQVIAMFKQHMMEALAAKKGRLYDELKALYVFAKANPGLVIELGCCCKPKHCHGDVIAEMLNAKLAR